MQGMIARMEKREERWREPVEFFARHSYRYHQVARQIAEATMRALRPPGAVVERWEQRVREVVEGVVIRQNGAELVLTLGRRRDGMLPENSSRSAVEMVSFRDIEEWIEAGRRGESGGKDLTRQDEHGMSRGNTPTARLAVAIIRAYYGKEPKAEWERLRMHIQNWMRGSDVMKPKEWQQAIIQAWQDALGHIMHRDMAAWVKAG